MDPIMIAIIALVVGFLAGLVVASQGKNKKVVKALDAFLSIYMGADVQNLDVIQKLVAFVEKVMADLQERDPETYEKLSPKLDELKAVLALVGKKKPDVALLPD